MLTIKTKLDKSHISGIGLFADQIILKGEIVWKMTSISALKISPFEYENLSEIEKSFLKEKDYYWLDENNNYMIPIDDSRFVNHSNHPNMIERYDNCYVSSRDIDKDEELTIDYKTLIPKELWEPYMTNIG